MIALLRRFYYWLCPWKAPKRCFGCLTTESLTASADGLLACPSCADAAIRSFTNREMRRTAKHNLKKGKR